MANGKLFTSRFYTSGKIYNKHKDDIILLKMISHLQLYYFIVYGVIRAQEDGPVVLTNSSNTIKQFHPKNYFDYTLNHYGLTYGDLGKFIHVRHLITQKDTVVAHIHEVDVFGNDTYTEYAVTNINEYNQGPNIITISAYNDIIY